MLLYIYIYVYIYIYIHVYLPSNMAQAQGNPPPGLGAGSRLPASPEGPHRRLAAHGAARGPAPSPPEIKTAAKIRFDGLVWWLNPGGDQWFGLVWFGLVPRRLDGLDGLEWIGLGVQEGICLP